MDNLIKEQQLPPTRRADVSPLIMQLADGFIDVALGRIMESADIREAARKPRTKKMRGGRRFWAAREAETNRALNSQMLTRMNLWFDADHQAAIEKRIDEKGELEIGGITIRKIQPMPKKNSITGRGIDGIVIDEYETIKRGNGGKNG